MTTPEAKDPGLVAAFWGVGVVGAVATVVGLATHGVPVAVGVSLGATLALSNLWVHARVVKMYLAGGGRVWAALGLIKVSALFGLVYLMVRRDLVDLMPLIAGYGALPVGILASHLRPAPAPVEER